MKQWGWFDAFEKAIELLPVELDKVHEFQTQVSRSQAGVAKARFEYVFHMAHCIRCRRRLVASDAILIIEERLKNDSANMRTSYKLHKSVIGDLQLRLAKQPRFHDLSEGKKAASAMQLCGPFSSKSIGPNGRCNEIVTKSERPASRRAFAGWSRQPDVLTSWARSGTGFGCTARLGFALVV